MSKTYNIKPASRTTKELPKSDSPMRARPRESITSIPAASFEFAGAFVIHCSNKQHYRLYSIYTKVGNLLIGRQASYPSIFDCLEKLKKAFEAGSISGTRYNSILASRAVNAELTARNTGKEANCGSSAS